LKIGNEIVVINIKLEYILAGKEGLAQGEKKKEGHSEVWLNLCMMPCLEIKERKKKKSLLSPSKALRSSS